MDVIENYLKAFVFPLQYIKRIGQVSKKLYPSTKKRQRRKKHGFVFRQSAECTGLSQDGFLKKRFSLSFSLSFPLFYSFPHMLTHTQTHTYPSLSCLFPYSPLTLHHTHRQETWTSRGSCPYRKQEILHTLLLSHAHAKPRRRTQTRMTIRETIKEMRADWR